MDVHFSYVKNQNMEIEILGKSIRRYASMFNSIIILFFVLFLL